MISNEDFVKMIEQKAKEEKPSLMLSAQSIVTVPPQIGNIQNLDWLMLDGNEIENLPETVARLKKLTFLSLAGNKLSSIPSCIFELDNLISLDLSGNDIHSVPKEIGNLSNLKRLDISNNSIEEIPDEIGQMSELEELIVCRNSLAAIPERIQGARRLRVIDVSDNQISNLPPQIALLDNLQSLVLSHNTLSSPPVEVISQGTKAIMAFLRNLQEATLRRYEAKLLILGEGGVGKSSLLRRFQGLEFEVNLFTTKGVDVASLAVRHPDYGEEKVQINVWDFAGQEIEHATHQFFMSDRSVYLLVWNSRHGHTQGRLDYWLERIKSHAPASPIILVATHVDERSSDVNFVYYKSNYPQLKEEHDVDNKNDRGTPALKSAIARLASKLPQMGQPWPSSWQNVEDELEKINEHHITYSSFKEICAANGLEGVSDIDSLSATLHSLGIVLHFKDDPLLRDLVILKPNWITKAISFALTDEKTKDSYGCLNHNELTRIWKDYDSSLHPAFFTLMSKFELCYQMENNDRQSLIPALLPFKPPALEDISPELQMVFRLSSVPAGLMSRFIVRTHRFTTNIHWREGALLEHDGQTAKAELMEDKREFVLSVSGSNPTRFFSVLIDTVEQILLNYPGLSIERRIPCTCSGLGHSEGWCGHYFTYQELVTYVEKGKTTIDCRVTLEEVNVISLLFGIHVSSRNRILSAVEKVAKEASNSEGFVPPTEEQRQMVLLAQRGVTDFLNKVENVDLLCPNVFTLSRKDNKIGVNLVCQCDDGWHLSSANTVILIDNDLKNRSEFVPLMAEYVGLFEYLIPLAGVNVNLRSPVSDEIYQGHKKNRNFMRELMESFSNDKGRVEGVQKSIRSLYFALQASYDQHGYTGLKRATTPDGYKVWLCPYHYAQLQPSSLQTMQKKFDVFLCHNSKDKDFVRQLFVTLTALDIKCWFDEEEILGGDLWQDSMATGLQESKCTLVCIGPNKWGNWQYEELQVALSQAAGKDSSHMVIPVMIPPVSSLPSNVPSFLPLRHVLRLSSLDNQAELQKVIKSIRRDASGTKDT